MPGNNRATGILEMPYPSVIPTESRATLREAEGEVRLSGGIPTLCPVPCRIREFYRSNFTCLAKCITPSRLLPLDMPSRTRASSADTDQFHALHSSPIRSCGRTGAGEGTAPLQPRVSRTRRLSKRAIGSNPGDSKPGDWRKRVSNPNSSPASAGRPIIARYVSESHLVGMRN